MVLNPIALFHLKSGSTVYTPKDMKKKRTASHVSAKEYGYIQSGDSDLADYDIDSSAYWINIGDTEVIVAESDVENIQKIE